MQQFYLILILQIGKYLPKLKIAIGVFVGSIKQIFVFKKKLRKFFRKNTANTRIF